MIRTQYELLKAVTQTAASVLKTTPSEKNTLIHIIGYMNNDFECFPSLKTIANTSGLGISTVKRSVKALVDKNILVKDKKLMSSGNENNLYRFNMKTLTENHTKKSNNVQDKGYLAPNGKTYSCPTEYFMSIEEAKK
ncbi:helix-turn-helix domain-containing protein [Vibrio natriegens]|uniref:helix-turn-helix domain-containing protein n=1 Tax=Vibrio natriegens TaxID=691 RepID=UPI0035565B86